MQLTTLSILWGGTSERPGGLYAEPHPPSLLKFIHLLHLNQAGVQDLISNALIWSSITELYWISGLIDTYMDT